MNSPKSPFEIMRAIPPDGDMMPLRVPEVGLEHQLWARLTEFC